MSRSHAMSKDFVSSEFDELVSDVKEEFVNSGDEREITFGRPKEKEVQKSQEQNSDSALELQKFNRNIILETPSVGDEVDIKLEVNDLDPNSTLDGEDDLHTGAGLECGSLNCEEMELNQLYLDLLKCERDCVTCQKYIRKLSQHVSATHAAGQPTRDPLHVDPIDMDQSSPIEIKCEPDVDVEQCYRSDESDSNSESKSNSEVENGGDSDHDYNALPDLTRKRKSGRKLGNDHKRYKSSGKVGTICYTKTQNRDEPFKCEKCGIGLTNKGGFTLHSKKCHTGEESFKCEECGKTFTWKDNLTRHMRIHTGQKPYKCTECAQSFSTKSKLSVHVLSHTGERPFKCEVCRKSFTRKECLNMHFKSISHLSFCDLSGRTGERPINLGAVYD